LILKISRTTSST